MNTVPTCRHGFRRVILVALAVAPYVWIGVVGYAGAEEPREWVGEVNFTLEGSGFDKDSDRINDWDVSWVYDEIRNARCTIRFCGKPGAPRILGVYRSGSWHRQDTVKSTEDGTRCFDREVSRRERVVRPGSRRDSDERTSGTLGESRRGAMGPAVRLKMSQTGGFDLMAVCEVTLAVTMNLEKEDYDACTGWSAMTETHLSPGAPESVPQSLPVEGGSHTVIRGPSSPSGRALALPWTTLEYGADLRGGKPISSIEGPGGTAGGKYVETITANWDIQPATSGCGCIATIDKLGGDVLINGQPVESSIIADASSVQITTGKKGRVKLHVGQKELNIGGNADITVDHLCDPLPHTPEAWEHMTPAEVWADIWSIKSDSKLMRGWIYAHIAVLVGAEANFAVATHWGAGAGGGVRGYLEPIFQSADPGYRLASYTEDPARGASFKVQGLEEVMPSQGDLDAAFGGVILGEGRRRARSRSGPSREPCG